MKITFLGATGTVTGSKYLLSFDDQHILVDCGLFQGDKTLRSRNWEPLPFNPQSINAVILTHAHIDHSGYLPLLVKHGFTGPIYCTHGTKELCEILLPDSAHIQEEDAQHANEKKHTKHQPALPLYTIHDAEDALRLFKPKSYHTTFQLNQTTHFQLIPAGHIIGSSFVQIHHKKTSLLFMGDLGRLRDDVMKAPTPVEQVDYLVTESTYGDRLHEKKHPKLILKETIQRTIERGGTVIIPAFAVGRTQSMLHYLCELRQTNEIPHIPIYLDSPMAMSATQVLCRHLEALRLTKANCEAFSEVVHYIQSIEDSRALDLHKTPKVILASSGMLTGGRVLFHLNAYASHPRNTILFTGYQSPSTRGADILSGKNHIKIHGHNLPIRAEIVDIQSTSAHADYEEILEWLSYFKTPPKKTFITHGEPDASLALKQKIEAKLGWPCLIPTYKQTEQLL